MRPAVLAAQHPFSVEDLQDVFLNKICGTSVLLTMDISWYVKYVTAEI